MYAVQMRRNHSIGVNRGRLSSQLCDLADYADCFVRERVEVLGCYAGG